MNRELKHPSQADALQSSNNPVNRHEFINTSVSKVHDLDEPFYCTINEFVMACPRINDRTLRRYIKNGKIEARRVSHARSRKGYKYEFAIYKSSLKEKIIRFRQEKLEKERQRFEEKIKNRRVNKVIKDISSKLCTRLVTAKDTNSEIDNDIKEHIILLLKEKTEELLSI